MGTNEALDIWVEDKAGGKLAIELKYFTSELMATVKAEQFWLKDQAATFQKRYDYYDAICRVERLVQQDPTVRGYVIARTNTRQHWNNGGRSAANEAFPHLFEHGVLASGQLAWKVNRKDGTKGKGRKEYLDLKGVYSMHWQTYSQVSGNGSGEFRYILIEVLSKSPV